MRGGIPGSTLPHTLTLTLHCIASLEDNAVVPGSETYMRGTQVPNNDLEHIYTDSLSSFLCGGGEDPLEVAYEVGRKALSEGYGLLEMVKLHHAALTAILRENSNGAIPEDTIATAGSFFAESISSFEMTQRAVGEVNSTLRKLNEALEEKIRHIALSLHDDAGQLIVVTHIALDEAMRELPQEQPELKRVKNLLEQVDDRIRHLSHELRPAMLDQLGLVPALKFLAASMEERSGLRIAIQADLNDDLPSRVAITLYRIVQEALTNIRRHAKASTVHIRIRKEKNAIRCSISDDGIGFDPETTMRGCLPGLGLIGIRERIQALGGSLQIRSTNSRGTRLEITAPLQEVEDANPGSARR